jgi:hypothetical protein
MNLTLASHHSIPVYPPASGSMECREGLTKQWLLDQRGCGSASFHVPSPRLLGGGSDSTATLGTTFPPQAHMLHAFRERLRFLGGGRNTCHSEPDLCHRLYGGCEFCYKCASLGFCSFFFFVM